MTDELDPTKFHVLTASKKRLLLIASVFSILVLFPLLTYFYYDFAINRPAQNLNEAEYEIKQGRPVAHIAKELYELKLINSEFLFNLYIRLSSLESDIQAGVYKVPAGASIVELVNIFQNGKNDKPVTFIEGQRVEEFALIAAQNFANVDYREFVEFGKQYEGSLFPDTYSFGVNASVEEIIERMARNFEDKTKDVLTEEALARVGLTKQEVLIFASIVEREIHTEKERPIVAGILINRYKRGELLGADATTQYVMANMETCSYSLEEAGSYCMLDFDRAKQVTWWPKDISIQDLESTDPFNTRKVVGLPPRPIANPGLSAISAVLNYTDTDYQFYLTDMDGVAHFGKTLEEHNANIQKYL